MTSRKDQLTANQKLQNGCWFLFEIKISSVFYSDAPFGEESESFKLETLQKFKKNPEKRKNGGNRKAKKRGRGGTFYDLLDGDKSEEEEHNTAPESTGLFKNKGLRGEKRKGIMQKEGWPLVLEKWYIWEENMCFFSGRKAKLSSCVRQRYREV